MEGKSLTQKKFLDSMIKLNHKLAVMALLQKLNVSNALIKLLEEK